jgi:hypothetical protein
MIIAQEGRAQFFLRAEAGLYRSDPAGTVVQRQPDGEPSAFALVSDSGYVVHFPGLASFRFWPGSDQMGVDAPATTSREVVGRLFRTVAIPFALQAGGFEALHASAVRSNRGVIAFCAHSGSGKSTLAYALATRRGLEFWSDDAVVIAVPPTLGTRHECLLLPQEPNLRPDSREFLDGALDNDRTTSDRDHDVLAAVVLIEPAPSDALHELVRLSAVDALTGILPHAFCFFVDEGREAQTVRALVDLSAEVPVFRMRFPIGFDRLEATVDFLVEDVPTAPEGCLSPRR